MQSFTGEFAGESAPRATAKVKRARLCHKSVPECKKPTFAAKVAELFGTWARRAAPAQSRYAARRDFAGFARSPVNVNRANESPARGCLRTTALRKARPEFRRTPVASMHPSIPSVASAL